MSASHGTLPAIAIGTAAGLQTGRLQSPLKVPCKSVAPLMNCAFLRRAQEASAHNTDAVMMEVERGDALFMLAGLAWCPR